MMTDRQLARHPLDDAIQVARDRDVGEQRVVFFLHRRPVHAVHVGRVKVVAVDPPRFVEDLRPLRARIDADLDAVDGEAPI